MTKPTPAWSRRRLLWMALAAAVMTVVLPLSEMLLQRTVAMQPSTRLLLTSVMVTLVVLAGVLTLSWVIMALARSMRNL